MACFGRMYLTVDINHVVGLLSYLGNNAKKIEDTDIQEYVYNDNDPNSKVRLRIGRSGRLELYAHADTFQNAQRRFGVLEKVLLGEIKVIEQLGK